jgi:methylmalonyl-CoA/ethylmalonyl-CoA epimerase
MRLFELDHVAIAARRIGDAEDLVRALGGRSDGGGPSPGFRWWQWIFAGGGRLEVLEPDGPPDGFLHRFLARHGPGIHHVTFKVPDLEAACASAESLGQRVVGYDDRHGGWKEAFLHPATAQGIVVQLAEEQSGGTTPAADASVAATLLGVRMCARDAARASALWHDVLHGEGEPTRDGIVFRWPGSPLRVAVRVDPMAEDRSEAIEIRGAGAHALPPGPHPLLGARFERVGD